jgi:hypothetical protein
MHYEYLIILKRLLSIAGSQFLIADSCKTDIFWAILPHPP